MLSEMDQGAICGAYVDDLARMGDLAEKYDITRQGVWKVLTRHGVDTSKRKLKVQCYWCGGWFLRTKARIRASTRSFCCTEHYDLYLRELGADYIENRQGGRIGRAVVSEHFDLEPGHIVHHEDKNQLNNDVRNLRVFVSQSDHIRYHRGVEWIEPVWDGRTP